MIVFAVTAIVAVVAAPMVRSRLVRRGLLDVPNHRSSHSVPVPRGGGIACVAGALAGAGTAALLHHDVPWIVLSGVALLSVVGYADDRLKLNPSIRLATQVVVGAAVGASFGEAVWVGIGALCIPVAVNAVNFMDGINGITSINAMVWGAVAVGAGSAAGATGLVLLGTITVGSALGFLPWNCPTARLFLGDVGSYFFGALIGFGSIAGMRWGVSPSLLLAPMAIYLADTGFTLMRRAFRRESLTTAHREHVYQRLVDEAGLAHLTVAAGSAMLSLLIIAAWLPRSLFLGMASTVGVTAIYLASPAVLGRRRGRRRANEDGVRTP